MVQKKKKKATKRKPNKPVVKKTVMDRVKQLMGNIGKQLPGCVKSTGNAVASVGVIVTFLATVAIFVIGARQFFDDPQIHLLVKVVAGGAIAICSGKVVALASKYV